MELEKIKVGTNENQKKSNESRVDGNIPTAKHGVQALNPAKATQAEVPSIRLSPEQIEEIHADEYSLTLFYATRVEPLTMNEIKREFPEPEPKKAQSVMDRFIKVGLTHITPEGAYYSNYPENYINYSHYRYDGDLEARKDSKVFQLMKEFTGKSEYWKDKTYFSMDAFYTQEQTDELLEMFKAIRLKAKEYANENAKKKSVRGLRFRRMKFYDMTFSILLAILVFMGLPQKSFAGGNDPLAFFTVNPGYAFEVLAASRIVSGGGNDPTMAGGSPFQIAHMKTLVSSDTGGGGHDPNTRPNGGGGHDPGNPPERIGVPHCYLELNGQTVAVQSAQVCRLKGLIDILSYCGESDHPICLEAEYQADLLLQQIELEGQSE